MHTFITSIIRTVIPAVVGALVAWLVTLGIDVPGEAAEALTAGVTVAAAAAYYMGIRWIEQRWPAAGVLLGVAKQPVYAGKGITEAELREAVKAAVPDGEGRYRAEPEV